MAEEFNEAATVAYFNELIEMERAGERSPVSIGPWSSMSVIILLQLALRHPEVSTSVKSGALDVLGQLEVLFDGTYGEQVIRAGYDTSLDVGPAGD